jgi:hypothetical protein
MSFLTRLFRPRHIEADMSEETKETIQHERWRTEHFWQRLREWEREAELETRKEPNPDYEPPIRGQH